MSCGFLNINLTDSALRTDLMLTIGNKKMIIFFNNYSSFAYRLFVTKCYDYSYLTSYKTDLSLMYSYMPLVKLQ